MELLDSMKRQQLEIIKQLGHLGPVLEVKGFNSKGEKYIQSLIDKMLEIEVAIKKRQAQLDRKDSK